MTLLAKLRQTRRIATILLVATAIVLAFLPSVQLRTVPFAPTHQLEQSSHAIYNTSYCQRDPRQTYDLYLPLEITEDPAGTPLVIYIHGGGWSSGDKQNSIANYYGSHIVTAGVAFASINYRLAPQHTYPAQNNDVACAINSIAQHAAKHHLDTSRVILFGDSAGGLLASMYALTTPKPPVQLRGVVSFYGTTDLVYQLTRKQFANKNALQYLGSNDITLARQASPLYQPVTRDTPPYLFFHGDKDTMVTLKQAYEFYTRVRAVQPSSQFVTVKQAGHGFTRTTSPTRAEIREMITEFAVQHLNRSEEYLYTPDDTSSPSHNQGILQTPLTQDEQFITTWSRYE